MNWSRPARWPAGGKPRDLCFNSLQTEPVRQTTEARQGVISVKKAYK